jgi:glutamate synthase (NADPH/NADH) small chain
LTSAIAAFPELHPPLSAQAAVIEANRCLYCYDAPCAAACPTHIDVPGFIKKIASGNLMGSARTILDANVLGLSCARVCPVDVLCEGACVMHSLNKQPIAIGLLQRHAMDHFYAAGGTLPLAPAETGRKVACIGAGPASLACAAELRRHGVAVTIFERKPLAGGLNTYGVAQYKFTPDDSRREVELIRATGVEFRLGIEVGSEIDIEKIEREFDAIFLGMGLGPTQPLGIEGEQLSGVLNAIEFIAAYKTGQPVTIGDRVAIIGGGNTAIDAAVAAKRLGAGEVTILYRRLEPQMPAFRFEYEHAKKEGVKFIFGASPVRFRGMARIEAVECASGLSVACDTAIVAIGQSKILDSLATRRGIELDAGRAVVNPRTGQTSNPKYFAGGDCVNGGREVVDAAADGKRAARGILSWLT